MFDLGWTELLLIGLVALIVVGPKDLPGMFRTLGRFTARAKGLAREFQRAMDQAADDAGVKDAAKDFKDMTNPKKMGLDALNDAADQFEKWTPGGPKIDGPPKTTPLDPDRAEAARKINEATAQKAATRQAAEAAAAADAAAETPEPADTTSKSDPA